MPARRHFLTASYFSSRRNRHTERCLDCSATQKPTKTSIVNVRLQHLSLCVATAACLVVAVAVADLIIGCSLFLSYGWLCCHCRLLLVAVAVADLCIGCSLLAAVVWLQFLPTAHISATARAKANAMLLFLQRHETKAKRQGAREVSGRWQKSYKKCSIRARSVELKAQF